MKPPKFNFTSERLLKESSKPKVNTFQVSVYGNSTLVFNSHTAFIYELDGKYIRLYGDPEKKAIGWSVFSQASDMEEMKDLRQLKKSVNGNIIVSIKKLLNSINYDLKGKSVTNLTVKEYRTPFIKDVVYFIELPSQTYDKQPIITDNFTEKKEEVTSLL